MRPTLFHLSIFGQTYNVESYIFFNILLSNLSLLIVVFFLLIRRGVSKRNSFFTMFVLVLVALVGSKVTHILGNMNCYFHNADPIQFKSILSSGFSLFGGILFALPFSFLISQVLKIPRWEFLDLLSPGMSTAIFFNKMGCFLNGCCFGTPTSLPWGVVFPLGTRAYNYYSFSYMEESEKLLLRSPGNIQLHPVQLYESLFGLFLFFFALILIRRKVTSGVVFLSIFYLFSFSRMFFYFFRAPSASISFSSQYLFLAYGISTLTALGLLYWRLRADKN